MELSKDLKIIRNLIDYDHKIAEKLFNVKKNESKKEKLKTNNAYTQKQSSSFISFDNNNISINLNKSDDLQVQKIKFEKNASEVKLDKKLLQTISLVETNIKNSFNNNPNDIEDVDFNAE